MRETTGDMDSILVALSGGVDSSLAAALLKSQGYRIAGAIMRMGGVSEEDIEAAQSIARHLAIPFFCFDFRQEFESAIIQYFKDEYCRGRTPNPCVVCNEHIKFGRFLEEAHRNGYDRIATGHYAGIEKTDDGHVLLQGVDRNEQSYFLYRLQQEQLAQAILPLQALTRAMVRDEARSLGLPGAARQKSQDVCFVPNDDYAAYLTGFVADRPGPIIDQDGRVIGSHQGIHRYTCGQRRGIGISSSRPLYVTKIDQARNSIHVGPREDVFKRELIAHRIRFVDGQDLERSLEVLAKPRYVAPLAHATIYPIKKGEVQVRFDEPQWALTPGQSVVFYSQGRVLGGGIIEVIA